MSDGYSITNSGLQSQTKDKIEQAIRKDMRNNSGLNLEG